MESWNDLQCRFGASRALDLRRTIGVQMAKLYPQQAWPFLQDTLWQGDIHSALPGLLSFPVGKVSAYLQRILLERGGDTDFLQTVVSALGQVQAYAVLVVLIEDVFTPPSLRQICLYECSRTQTPDTEALFLKELANSSLQRKHQAVLTLGRWRYAMAAQPLLALLKVHLTTVLLAPLCWALGQIASIDSIRGLSFVMVSAPIPVQLQMAEVLSTISLSVCAEPIEACLLLAEEKYRSLLQRCLDQHQQHLLERHKEPLETLRYVWEENLFASHDFES